jgi:hypothetical protein
MPSKKIAPRALREIDFLLMVYDVARQGALRFKREEHSSFLTNYNRNNIPPLVEVGKLLTAANHVLQDSESKEDLRLLLAPGSSLGGQLKIISASRLLQPFLERACENSSQNGFIAIKINLNYTKITIICYNFS